MSLDLLRPNFLDFLASEETAAAAWCTVATGDVAFEAFFDSPLLYLHVGIIRVFFGYILCKCLVFLFLGENIKEKICLVFG